MGYQIKTIRGYDFGEATSAMQKAIRRNDARVAGYFAIEFYESNMAEYVWRRLLTISAEDCAGIITQEIEALRQAYLAINENTPKSKHPKGRIFIAKAVILLCIHPKSRDSDHLTNLVYDRKSEMSDEQVENLLQACRGEFQEPIPDYALDCHTRKGKNAGRTKEE